MSEIFKSCMFKIFGNNSEKMVSVLTPCIKDIIIKPRITLLNLLDELYQLMEQEIQKSTIDTIRKEILIWIEKDDIKLNELLKQAINEETLVPKQIIDIFEKHDLNFINMFLKYQDLIDYVRINNKTDDQLSNWGNPRITYKVVVNQQQSAVEVKAPNTGAAGESYISEQPSYVKSQELAEENLDKQGEQIKKRMEKLQIFASKKKNIELRDRDTQNFLKIFANFRKEGDDINKQLTKQLTNQIELFWFGNVSRNGFPGNNASYKIKKVDAQISRIIFQTYIVGLFVGSKIMVIYKVASTCINTPISSEDIYQANQHIPNSDVLKILGSFINGYTALEPDLEKKIRKNWDTLKKPSINLKPLLDYLRENNIENVIINQITKLDTHKTIEVLAKEIYNIIPKKKVNLIAITSKLTYE